MNTQLFQTTGGKRVATVRNAAGGRAYDPGAEHGLAQMAVTCTLADSYYTSADQQLQQVLDLADQCTPEYVGQLAVYAREQAQMKDLPALLTAYLASKYEHSILDKVFHRTIDNGRMVRGFVQILRSGRLGRRGLGSQPKRLLRQWFAAQGAEGVFRNSVGSTPSMVDCIKLVRPVPLTEGERDMYRYLIGKGPATGVAFELKMWSEGRGDIPKLPFEFLAGAAKTPAHWEQIAHNLSWNATLKNLNTFLRHKVSQEAWNAIGNRLLQPVPRHVFPYNVMTAYNHLDAGVPRRIYGAVQDALDNSLANIPALQGNVAVCIDVSGSMGAPVTGYRRGATSVATCNDVATLFAAAILKKQPEATIVAFDTSARELQLNPRDSVVTMANSMNLPGGGTDVGCALRWLNSKGKSPDTTVIISDNESWFEGGHSNSYWSRGATGAQTEWDKLAGRNKQAKLVCLDIQANPTIQVRESKRVLNLGGFSDKVFTLISDFSKGHLATQHWVDSIKKVEL